MASQIHQPVQMDTRQAVALGAATAAVVAAIGTFLFVSTYDGKVVPGVRVDGVPIGGLPPDSASTLVVGRVRTIGEMELELRAGDQRWQPTAAELGVAMDPRTLADKAYSVGRVGSPLERSLSIGSALFRPIELTAPSVDRARVSAWVDDAAARFDRPPIDAALTISPNGRVQMTAEHVGRRLERARATEAIERELRGWLRRPTSPPPAIDLPFTTLQPSVTAASVEPARVQAEAALSGPLTLKLDQQSWKLPPAELAPLLKFQRDGVGLRLDVDAAAVGALVDRLAGQADRRPTDATLALSSDGKVVFKADQSGREVDRAAAREQIRAALVNPNGTGELALPAARIPARVRADDLAPAREALQSLLAGPVKLTAGDKSVTFQPKEVAAMVRIVDGPPTRIELDDAKFKPAIEKLAERVERAPRQPRVKIVGGSGSHPSWLVGMPGGGADATVEQVAPGEPGRHLDVARALDSARKALLRSGERNVSLPVETTPVFEVSNRAALGPLEYIEGSTTSYAGSVPERRNNVELAAARLNGVIVPPGTTLSFNEALGSTSIDNGYLSAWGFAGGPNGAKVVPSVGGGICQIATTLFQAVFWAGYQIEERSWHLFPIPRYSVPPRGMPGLDATVDEASGVDLKWTNNTDNPVVVQAHTDGANVSFALYGTKPSWQVRVDPAVVGNVVRTSGRTVTQYEPSLPAGKTVYVEEAHDGYTATVRRTVTEPGKEPRVLVLTSTYQPSENIIAVGTGGRR